MITKYVLEQLGSLLSAYRGLKQVEKSKVEELFVGLLSAYRGLKPS